MKPWYKQKTFWAGVVLVITGIGTYMSDGGVAEAASQIGTGLGMIFLREAISKSGAQS